MCETLILYRNKYLHKFNQPFTFAIIHYIITQPMICIRFKIITTRIIWFLSGPHIKLTVKQQHMY